MGSLSQFRTPQFSEDSAWLPVWLQQCDVQHLNVEDIKKDQPTFEQCIEKLHFFHKSTGDGEPLKEDGGCNIGQLFLSGTESSPLSFGQSANNVVHFRLCLSSESNLENTTPTTDAWQTESICPLVMPPLESSAILSQKAINLNLFYNHEVNLQPTMKLEKPLEKNELLKHEENEKISEDADDAAELCIEASEALVINDVIEDDSFMEPSASATLEASLQVKQARLEVWSNTIYDKDCEIIEDDDLSDLDDITMESAYEDAGIMFNELSSCEPSLSRVKDTLDSEYDENLKHGTTRAFAICGKSCDDNSVHRMEVDMDNDRELEKDLIAECIGVDVQNKVTSNLKFGLCNDVGYDNDRSRPVEAQERFGLSLSEEKEENSSREPNVSSSPLLKRQDPEKEDSLCNIVQEKFQSRWFGGWTGNNEAKHLTIVKHRIRAPFVGETSFLSESADSPDENSFVQNNDNGAILASQLSIPSENFSNRGNDNVILSQDVVRSSSESFVDPLCSVVPCSISEDIGSSPAINHDNKVLTTIELAKSNVVCSSQSKNELTQGGRNAMPIGNDNEVCRRVTPLSSYSKLLPSYVNLSEQHGGYQKRTFLINSYPELTIQETPLTNYEEAVKDVAEFPVLLKSKWSLLKCKSQSGQQFPTPKRVHFPDTLENEQTSSKKCCSSRAAKKPTTSTRHLESKAQQMNILLKNPMNQVKKRLIFQNMEFLLTGFSHPREKEIEGLIRKYGGIVISQIPSTNLKGKRSSRFKSQVLPVVLCLKKTQSFKFLYGCAVNAFVLKSNWLVDSIAAGVVLPPKRYMILSRNIGRRHAQVYSALNYDKHSLVFYNTGIMLHGKSNFFTNIATIIQHGGGQVFKTLQRLVQTLEAGKISTAIVVADDESCASRHLKHCALEQNVPMTSISWIIKSLYAGQLIPLEEKHNFRSLPVIKLQKGRDFMELSQEI